MCVDIGVHYVTIAMKGRGRGSRGSLGNIGGEKDVSSLQQQLQEMKDKVCVCV